MAFIHITAYCPKCKKYFENKAGKPLLRCPSCTESTKPQNKWYVTFRALEWGVYKQKKLGSFNSKKEATEAQNEFMSKYVATSAPKVIDFQTLIENYKLHLDANSKESTFVTIESKIRNGITPYFPDNFEVEKITLSSLNLWKIKLTELYSENHASNLWNLMGSLLIFADREFEITQPVRVYRRIPKVKVSKKKKDSWTNDEWKKFIAKVEELHLASVSEAQKNGRDWKTDHAALGHFKYYVLFNFLYFVGDRKGEATAETWNKVHFEEENNYIVVDETISYKIKKENRKKGILYNVTSNKNNKERIVEIPQKTANLLKKLKEVLISKESDFIFFGKNPLPPQTLRNRLDWYIKQANVKRITPHQFRHSHASLIFSVGENDIAAAYATAERLGHNVKYALETYGNLYESERKKIVKKLEE